MEIDPFEEFRKKKLISEKNTVESGQFYDMPVENKEGKAEGLVTHRFSEEEVVVERPSGFEATELGHALKDPMPEVKKPSGFRATSLTDTDNE